MFEDEISAASKAGIPQAAETGYILEGGAANGFVAQAKKPEPEPAPAPTQNSTAEKVATGPSGAKAEGTAPRGTADPTAPVRKVAKA